MHHAGVPELAQAGIDDGVPGMPALPGGERGLVAFPREAVEVRLQVLGGEVGMVVQQVTAELAPAELAQELLDAGPEGRLFRRREPRRMPDWRGLGSPNRRCGDRLEVPSRSGRSRSPT